MKSKKIKYFIDEKEHEIKAKICNTPSSKFSGLMFKRNSPPLLFVFDKRKKLSIHSFFCKPFKAIWLDDRMNSTEVIDVRTWKLNISGTGKYLLEIPLSLENDKSPTTK